MIDHKHSVTTLVVLLLVGLIGQASAQTIFTVSPMGGSTGSTCKGCPNPGIGDGGGIYVEDGSLTVTNSIAYWNLTSDHGMGEQAQISSPNNPKDTSVAYSCIQGYVPAGDLAGPGNIGDDPLFVDREGPDDLPGTADDDLRLADGSPCVDAGDNTALPPDTQDLDGDLDTAEPLPVDAEGLARTFDVTDVVDTGAGTAPLTDLGSHEFQFCQLDLGAQGPGDMHLTVCGAVLATGNLATLEVSGARPFEMIYFVFGLQATPTPFEGGILVPLPLLGVVTANVTGEGSLTLDVRGGNGPGTLYLQSVSTSGKVYELSNALALDFAP